MRTILFSIILFISSTATFAQKKGDPVRPSNTLDQKYTPPTSSIFNSKSDDNSVGIGKVKTMLGYEITLLTRGVVGFSAERQIGKSPLSINGGLGFVFSKDMLQYVMSSPDFFDAYSGAKGTQYDLGSILKYSDFMPERRFFGTLGLRIYPNYTGNLDGTYFEVGMRWHNYETRLSKVDTDPGAFDIQVPKPILVQIKTTTYSVKYGIQYYSGSGRYYTNLYAGLGIRKAEFNSINKNHVETYSPEFGYNDYYELKPNGMTAIGFMPVVLFGWELAFGM
jgi:hypothetical protein